MVHCKSFQKLLEMTGKGLSHLYGTYTVLVTGKSIYETLIVVESDLISDTKLLAFGFPLLTVEFSDIYN